MFLSPKCTPCTLPWDAGVKTLQTTFPLCPLPLCWALPIRAKRGDYRARESRKAWFLLVCFSCGNSYESHSSNFFTLATIVPSHSRSEMQLTVFPTLTKALYHFNTTSSHHLDMHQPAATPSHALVSNSRGPFLGTHGSSPSQVSPFPQMRSEFQLHRFLLLSF